MITETVLDIEVYGPEDIAKSVMDLLLRSLNDACNMNAAAIWRLDNNERVKVEKLELSPDESCISDKLWKRVVDGELSDNEFFYSLPNLVLLNNSYNPNWIKRITHEFKSVTINVTECSELCGVTLYRATNGNFDFYKFHAVDDTKFNDNYDTIPSSLFNLC